MNNEVLKQIESAYIDLCARTPGLTYLETTKTLDNSYRVDIQTDNSIEKTSDKNSQEQNLDITKRWGDLVKIDIVKKISEQNNLWIVNIHNIDSNGHSHSVAIV